MASSQSYGFPFWPRAIATSQSTIKVMSTTSRSYRRPATAGGAMATGGGPVTGGGQHGPFGRN